MKPRLFRRAFAILSLALIAGFQNCSAPTQFSEDSGSTEQSSKNPGPSPTPGPTTGSARGTVTHALTNAKLPGVSVSLRNASSPAQVVRTAVSSGAGAFSLGSLPTGNYLVEYSADGFIPVSGVLVQIRAGQETVLTQSLSPTLAAGQLRIVLNWCDLKSGAVEDVDAYLSIPGEAYPIYFNNKTGPDAQLDIDILLWKGPETITIDHVRSGTYIYYVNNFSHRHAPQALGASEVRVAVFQGSQMIRSYSVPAGTGITYEVFRIVNGQIQDMKRYNDSLPVATP